MPGIRSIIKILTLTCEESARIASDSYERELGWAERAALKVHLLNCRWCRRVRAQLETMHLINQKLRDVKSAEACCPHHGLSSEAKRRMIERLT